MTNSTFWESYKAKCLEKGLPPRYENEEEFSKAMTEPPKPYSTDDFTPKRDIEGWHAAEEGIDDIDDEEETTQVFVKKCNNEEIMWELERMMYEAEETEKIIATSNKPAYDEGKGDAMTQIQWFRCESCEEMKDENAFKKYRNGTFAKVCNACIGSKIRDAKAKRIEKIAPMIEQKQIYMGIDKARDTSSTVILMKLDVFHSALRMAYERGIAEGKTFADMTITEDELPVILDEVLGVSA